MPSTASQRPARSARRSRTALRGGAGEGGEVDMGGEIDLARRGEGIDRAMAGNRLQGVATRRSGIAVVDDNRDAALAGARRRASSRAIACDAGESSAISAAVAGSGRKPPPTSRPTQRSRPPIICRIGNASKNSLATTSSGRSDGSVAMLSCQWASGRRSACFVRSAGLVSTRWIIGDSAAARIARRASPASVPRPGPNSTKAASAGRPARTQTSASASPISSPNIWLISGAVMKSPSPPIGSRVANNGHWPQP